MPRGRCLLRSYGLFLALAAAVHPPPASAQSDVCRPQKIIRYLDVDLAVSPASGAADRQVTLSARCLPADKPVIVWSGQAFDAVQPVSTGSIDSAGSFVADAIVPADAEPGKNYYFAIMIEDHVVGTGAFMVDGAEAEAATQ